MLTLKRMLTLLIPYQLVCLLPLVTTPFVLIYLPIYSAVNSTSSNSTSGSGQKGSGNTKNGAFAGVVTNLGGLAVAVVLGVLSITI